MLLLVIVAMLSFRLKEEEGIPDCPKFKRQHLCSDVFMGSIKYDIFSNMQVRAVWKVTRVT